MPLIKVKNHYAIADRMGPAISIILATYNESRNLPTLLESIDRNLSIDHQIIFVDDGSTDGTREIILDYIHQNPKSKYIFNNGKQSTLRARAQGIKQAEGEFIVVMDSDLQHPPELIPTFYRKLIEGCDIVIGSRYARGGSTGNRKPIRGLISRVAGELAYLLLKSSRKTTDPTSEFFAFKAGLFKGLNEKWRGYEIHLFILAQNLDKSVCDAPYRFRERPVGESKVTEGMGFIRAYVTELILAKKTELRNKKELLTKESAKGFH
jgi:dolichol-phosphate mannosyltransferase